MPPFNFLYNCPPSKSRIVWGIQNAQKGFNLPLPSNNPEVGTPHQLLSMLSGRETGMLLTRSAAGPPVPHSCPWDLLSLVIHAPAVLSSFVALCCFKLTVCFTPGHESAWACFPFLKSAFTRFFTTRLSSWLRCFVYGKNSKQLITE